MFFSTCYPPEKENISFTFWLHYVHLALGCKENFVEQQGFPQIAVCGWSLLVTALRPTADMRQRLSDLWKVFHTNDHFIQ